MRFLASTRDVKSIGSIAAGLSLAVANYKPVPQLPTSNSSLSNSSSGASGSRVPNGYQLMPMDDSSSGEEQAFKVQSSDAASAYQKKHPSNEWGETSVLYVPAGNTTSRQLAPAATVGPGKCPVTSEYTPNGGWDALPAPTFAEFDPVQANVYRYRQQQGVNLGGWFVQEGWMESSFMACAGGSAEYDIVSAFGTSETGRDSARNYMEKHWDTWITEDDFVKMQGMGINTVRIPIGYWSVGPYFTQGSVFEPYGDTYYFSWRYVARAINWAAKYGIGVIIDLHGAYGSQNGNDHSGTSDGKIGFYTADNMQKTTNVLVWLAQEISDVTNVVGIQVLNEPRNNEALYPWFNSAMDAMRNASEAAQTVPLYFHDAFNQREGAAFVATRKDFVVQDNHAYFVYTTADQAQSAAGHTSVIQGSFSNKMQAQSDVARRNVITGEWSCALAPSSLAGSSNRQRDQTNYCTAQVDSYAKTRAGWTFWSWTMENCQNNSGWCFQQAVKAGFLSRTSFDSWGLQSRTKSYFNALNGSNAASTIRSMASKINGIPLQRTISSFSALADTRINAVIDDEDAAAAFGDTEENANEEEDTSVPVNVKGFIDMLDKDDVESQPSAVGDVVKEDRRGTGSVAARAAELVKRQASNAQLVSFYGYNDGFKSARYFAGNERLSRLGFAIQYRADSYRARVAQGNIQPGEVARYRAQYAAGVLAAESLIASIVTASS